MMVRVWRCRPKVLHSIKLILLYYFFKWGASKFITSDFTILQLSPHFFRRIWPLILRKINPLHPSKLYVKLRYNVCRSSGEEFLTEFLLFCSHLPFEKGLDLHIKNWIRCFVSSLVENVPVVLGKKTSNSFQQCIFTILQLSPLWKGCDPSVE